MPRKKKNPYPGKKQEEEFDLLSDQDIADLDAVLRTPAGRRLYHRIVYSVCSLRDSSFAGEIKDGMAAAMHTSFRDGARWVGGVLLYEAHHAAEDLWLQAEKENLALKQADLRGRKVENKSAGENDG